MYRKSVTLWPVVFLSVAGFVSASCGSKAPTSPTSSSTSSGSTGSTTSGAKGTLTVTVNPNPVPFSGKPITDIAGCQNRNNTWYYDQVLEETSGSTITINSEIDMLDGFIVNNLTGLRMTVPARGKLTLTPRWCSSDSKAHTAQHMFGGVDASGNALSIEGPLVNLMAAGK